MSSSVRWVACTALVSGPSTPRVGEHLGGRDAVRRQAGVVLRDLLGEVDVEGRPAVVDDAASWSRGRRGPSGSRRRSGRRSRVPKSVDARRPGGGAAVAVPHLHALGRLPEARAR